jgi:hypothetical protein
MRFVLLFAIGCAAQNSHYRDIEGRPLATTARIDADVEPVIVRCGGERYAVIPVPHNYSIGAHVGTHRPFVRDHRLMCAKIRAADE